MKIIQESYEAIKMIKFLSTFPEGEIVPAKEIASEKNISLKFALKILQILKKAEIVEAHRGIKGGYNLKVDEINLYEIIMVIQGELYLVSEFKKKKKEKELWVTELKDLQNDIIDKLKKMKITKIK
ncbi:Rrf2 family transcriptional regulator [Fusobacterium sp.]|uniref:RrF2 family transcriptional regulator n=1 Tax=Fusobacterium sp. TaxID=68766 RepID=UPI0029024B5E|nr:Rrf2 family transcriptional regulator [Fusobacterium sp.]MDU1912355.1 Rrf2 family transcriptional regulator [Fusobacterium sp.]